ncbi:MAG: hypothetical protein HC824_15710 [Synechococcales cyanobacterium RM1_1_8]|nr:hypothetical protein [Synechococcales cyanobacterium RM1_1_8]
MSIRHHDLGNLFHSLTETLDRIVPDQLWVYMVLEYPEAILDLAFGVLPPSL